MPQATIINKFGRITGWNELTVRLLNRSLEGITEVSYTDEKKIDNEYGAGGYPIGESEGNYEAQASMTLYSEELVGLQKSLPPGMRIQQIPAFDVICMYELNGVIMKDVLRNCRFKTNGREPKQNEGKIVQKIDLKISHIDYNVQ